MVKNRFTASEIRQLALDFKSRLVGLRISNIYDLDARVLLFKFAKPDAKEYVLVELGARMHTTKFDRDKPTLPGPFAVKLRKHLRARKCEDASQVGTDRIIKLTFFSVVVYFEFFAKGNVIVCDRENRQILAVMRPLDGFRIGDTYNEDIAENNPVNIHMSDHPMGYVYDGEATFEPIPDKVPLEVLPMFVDAVDAHFSKMDMQRNAQQKTAIDSKADKKMEKVKMQQGNRVKGLQASVAEYERFARLIQLNKESVDQALEVVRSGVGQGLDWAELKRIFKEQKRSGNPVALMVHSLKLEKNAVSLELDGEEEDLAGGVVDLDLSLSAMGNATQYFELRKTAEYKLQKTIEYEGKVLREKEKKTMMKKDKIADSRRVGTISNQRPHFFFEKFHWFISSDKYLIISGRDAQQNERLVKRYLRASDLYVHADVRGAASCIVRNRNPGHVIPENTIMEAGCFAVARSAAWDAKVMTAAWWVYAHQVSKTAQSGEYLPTGSFMIRGQKNYVTPQPLILGFACLFRTVSSKKDESNIPEEIMELGNKSSNSAAGVGDVQTVTSLEETDSGKRVDHGRLDDGTTGLDDSDNEDGGEENREAEDLPTAASQEFDLVVHTKGLPGVRRPRKGDVHSKPAVSVNPHITNDAASKKKESVRGKRSKQKKMKSKYADQDEEDRALMMAYLGHKATPVPAATPRVSTTVDSPELSEEEEEAGQTSQASMSAETRHAAFSSCPVSDDEPSETTSNQDADHVDATQKESNNESMLDVDDEEDAAEAAAVERSEGDLARTGSVNVSEATDDGTEDENAILDFLTGNPSPDDEFLFIIPMVAPYSTCLSFRYKARVTPGALKRGKAIRDCLSAWSRDSTTTPVHRELLKNVNEIEASHQMLGNVKIQVVSLKERDSIDKPRGSERNIHVESTGEKRSSPTAAKSKQSSSGKKSSQK
eukprot:ANDGO_02676.mRNA.1 Ribosome quality control complex subunit 2